MEAMAEAVFSAEGVPWERVCSLDRSRCLVTVITCLISLSVARPI